MLPTNSRSWAGVPLFDPEQGTVIRPPPGKGPGWWAGAPGVYYDAPNEVFYLLYRLRRPRGLSHDRGAEVRIARSSDGIHFDDVWAGFKEQLRSASIERCALTRDRSGKWLLYVSHVSPADQRWRIDLVEASRPEAFDLVHARPALTAEDVGAEGVKDPFVFQVGGLYHMIVSYAIAEGQPTPQQLHHSADAYNTGLIKSATGLAVSDDGRYWQWEGGVFLPRKHGWDRYCSRIGTLWHEPPVWLAYYDGSADVSENYEERCGLAYSLDLRAWHRVSFLAPLLTSPHATGSLRYVDVISLPHGLFFYYEMARADGGHELRVFHQGRT
jgi:hypothetical protein